MSPYQRIAEDIRRQIERGHIAVGERVPTVRDVARKYKVAAATAAHALRALTDEGIVRSVPRVGTIVASPRLRASIQKERATRDDELTRARIVAAAIAIADREGIERLSLRAVASKVDAPVMSLYRHVASKAELLRAMTDVTLGEETLPKTPPRGWRAQLETGARAEWRVFRRHPWLARVLNLTRPEPLPSSLAYADWMFHALGQTRAPAVTQMRVHILIHSFVQSMAVNLEAEAEASSESGLTDDEWMQQRMQAFDDAATSGKYPSFGRVLGALDNFDIDFDELFEMGLAVLLDGFTPLLTK